MLNRPNNCTNPSFQSLIGDNVIVFAFRTSIAEMQLFVKKPSKKKMLEGEAVKAEANRLNQDLPPITIIGFPLNFFDEKELKIIKAIAKYAKSNQ